jgi:hypothetical protein
VDSRRHHPKRSEEIDPVVAALERRASISALSAC